MEIDSGDESTPQQQQQSSVTVTKQQQQLSQEQLNTMAQTMQVFPNLLPTIQQQLQQQTQQQNSYLLPNQTSNYASLLPTPAAATATVRPGFAPMNMTQPRNLPPLLPPSLPALPLTQPALSSLNISRQLPPHIVAIQNTQQQVGVPSLNQSLNPLQGNIINNQLNSVIQNSVVLPNQQHQPQVPYRNNQQVLGTMNGGPRQSFNQQQVAAVPVPITSSLQPLPTVSNNTVVSSWPDSTSHSAVNTFTTSSADHTPLFLKAARANATVNIAPPVAHPSATESIPTRPLLSSPMPQLPVAVPPSSLTNTGGILTPYSQVSANLQMNVVQSSSLPVPMTTIQAIHTKPVMTTSLAETAPLLSSSLSMAATVSVAVPTATTSTPSTNTESALALASSLVPGLDTEVLQSILRTVKIGSGNKTTSSDDTKEVSMDESSKATSDTLSTFEADDVRSTGDPNIVMFGERKRKPSNEKETTSQVDNFEPDPKLVKVDIPTTKANIPPWLQGGGGGASINGPISSSSSDSNDKEQSELADKDRPPLRPYFRDLGFDHGPPMKSQQQPTLEDEAPYTFDDNDYEPFDPKVSFIKDYGHGQKASSMDYNHGSKQIGSQELSGGQESDKQLLNDDDSGSESPGTDQGLCIKESPIKEKNLGQGINIKVSKEGDVLGQKTDQESTSVPIVSDQGHAVVYQKPPVLYKRPGHVSPIADQKPSHGPVTDQRPSHDSPITDQRPSHGPIMDQKPSHGPPMMGQRPADGSHMTDQKTAHGPPIADQRHALGPPMMDQRSTHGPHMMNQRPDHGSPMADQIHTHGPPMADQIRGPMADQRPGYGPPMANQRPGPEFSLADQRPGHGPPMADQRPNHGVAPLTDERPDHVPSIRDQPFNTTDQRNLGRGQEPFINDQRRNQGFPVKDQGPTNHDHIFYRNQDDVPARDYRFPIRNQGPRDQWPPVRHQGFQIRGQEPPLRYARDQSFNQGPPGRDQVPPVGNQGPFRDQRPGQGVPISDQLGQGSTMSNQGSQECVKETTKDQEPSCGEHNQEQGLFDRDQGGQKPHMRDQQFSTNDQGPHDRGHGPVRNSPEPPPERYRLSRFPPPDHFDRPFLDKYYRDNDRPPDRPPWRPPMGPRRMSPPPFHHPPPRNMRFPPPHDLHRPEYSPRHPPPHHHYGHAPPRLPPYRQPY